MIGQRPVCYDCKHYDFEKEGDFCSAFPNGIPDIISLGGDKHSKPLKNQKNNIIFEDHIPVTKDENMEEIRELYIEKFGVEPPIYEMQFTNDKEYIEEVKKAIKDNKPISRVIKDVEF